MESERMTNGSVHVALGCDDVLCEILLCLPAKYHFKFLTVSKQWLRLICSSSFHQRYLTRWRGSFHLLGFFVQNFLHICGPRNGIRRPPGVPALPLLSTCKEGDDLKFSGFLNRLGYFIDSSNSLLLCGFHPKTYYVCNPITEELFHLPQPQMWYRDFCTTFVYEECLDDVSCYKVIRANCEYGLDEVNTVSIETFSSKTGTWEPSTLTCSSTFALCPWKAATVIRGVIHWRAIRGNVAIYDPDLGEDHVALIELPSGELSIDHDESCLGESSDGFLQYGQSSKLGIEIWVLEKEHGDYTTNYSSDGHSGKRWNLRYRLSFKTMWKKNPAVMTAIGKKSKESQLLSLLPQNSESVYIRSGQNILLYNLESGRLEVVRYHGCGFSISWDFSKVVPYFGPTWPHSPLCHKRKTSTC